MLRLPTSRTVQGSKSKSADGQVICLFGDVGVGTSTVMRLAKESSRSNIVIVAGIENAVWTRGPKPDIIFVDDWPPVSDSIQKIYDLRLVTPAGGAIVRVATTRHLVGDWTSIERMIRDLGMPYFVIMNDELDVAVGALLRRAGIRR